MPSAVDETLVVFAASPTPSDLGFSVAGVGNKVLIGAWLDNTQGFDAGAAYLFDAPSGDFLGTFFSPNPGNSDHWGFSVAGVGNRALIGVPLDPTGAPDAGAVYLFTTIPEPSTASLAIAGMMMLWIGRRRAIQPCLKPARP